MRRSPAATRAAALALALAASGLAACDGLRETFGLLRTSPDEFNVVARAPLEIPADLDRLPQPRPGLVRPQEPQPSARARAALFGGESPQSDASRGERLLAAAAIAAALAGGGDPPACGGEPSAAAPLCGAEALDPGIRRAIDSERRRILDDTTWLEDINPFRRRGDPTELAIDVARERARLRDNAALGLAPHVGDLEDSIVVQEEKALLEDLF